jgi:plastocyanin
MTRLRVLGLAALLALGAAAFATLAPAGSADDDSGGKRIAIEDDCDPRDPGWDTIPGDCRQRRGDVSAMEFGQELSSGLSTAVVGHQAWRNDPSYLKIKSGTTVRVENEGGRPHTFTKVAAFGGGSNPPGFNQGLTPSPECAAGAFVELSPGDRARLSGLTVGNNKFICCFHPWMRALIKVTPRNRGGGDDD